MNVLKTTVLSFVVLMPLLAFADSKPVTKSDMPKLEASCQAGNGNDCQALGRVYRDKKDAKAAGVRFNLTTSLEYYNLGCTLGDSGACGSVNRIYADKNFKGYDPIRAHAYFVKKCGSKGPESGNCRTLAKLEADLKKPKWQRKLKAAQN